MSPTTNLETLLLLDRVIHDKGIVPFMSQLKQYDNGTYEHCKRVAELSVKLGKMDSLDEDDLETLAAGALLHDIGKLSVPKKIINKPGGLDTEEKQEVQKHVSYGLDRINGYPDMTVKNIVAGHHEYQDQPYTGRSADEVPKQDKELTQIVALADEYDALTSRRPYKKGLDSTAALGILEKHYTGSRKYIESLRALVCPCPA